MGAEIMVDWKKEVIPVEDVTSKEIVIRPDSGLVNIPLSQQVNLFIKESLKVAAAQLEVSDFKAERAYSPALDPIRRMATAAALASGPSQMADLASGQVMQANMHVMGAYNVLNAARGTPLQGQAEAAVAQAEAEYGVAAGNLNDLYNTPVSNTDDLSSSAAAINAQGDRFDAIRVTFDVTTDRNLKDPYYAVIAQIRNPGSKKDQVRKWAYLKSLGGPLHPGQSAHVLVYQSGLPQGYILESCEVHLYDRKNELATNLSSKRMELTTDEAIDFEIVDYISANKGRTMPASLLSAGDPASAPERTGETCHVRVGPDGRVVGVFSDSAGKKPLNNPAIEASLKQLRFKPALDAGKPVESIVAIKLGGPPAS